MDIQNLTWEEMKKYASCSAYEESNCYVFLFKNNYRIDFCVSNETHLVNYYIKCNNLGQLTFEIINGELKASEDMKYKTADCESFIDILMAVKNAPPLTLKG